jgi:hypothetical protein
MFETEVYSIKKNKARENIVKLLCPGKGTGRKDMDDLLTIQYVEDTKVQSINLVNSRGNARFSLMDDPWPKVGIFIAD